MKKIFLLLPLLFSFLTSCNEHKDKAIIEMVYMGPVQSSNSFVRTEDTFVLYVGFDTGHIITKQDLAFLEKYCSSSVTRHFDSHGDGKESVIRFYFDTKGSDYLVENYILTKDITLYYSYSF